MRTMKCSAAFLRLLAGGVLACYSLSLPAAPVVLLEKARLAPSDGAPDGGFGRSVAIDGNVAVITANNQQATHGAGEDLLGAAYVFERQASGAWIQTAKLTTGDDGDLYGIDVAVGGNVIVVAAVFSGLAHVYEKISGSWQQTAVLGSTPGSGSGFSVAIENGIIAIGEEEPHGAVLYQRQATGWVRIASYENGFPLGDDEYYSPRVDISPNYAIHGSWGFDSDPPHLSTAYIYKPGPGGNWAQPTVTALTQPNGPPTATGWSRQVMISANTALIEGYVFRPDANGQWRFETIVPGASQLDDDEVTILGFAGAYRYAQLHRRTTSGDAWPVRAELAASDEARITSMSSDAGRALLASYRSPTAAAYLYEVPSNLNRNALVEDTFQDGDAVGWVTTPGSTFAVATSGTSRFYRQTNTTGNAAALWQTTPNNDQSIQADITPRAFDGADRWFGLVTRYSDANNYYYVTARSGGGIHLKRMLGGTFTTLGTAALPVTIGATHRIRLEAVADHIRVLVNNRPVIRVRDSGIAGGGQPGVMMFRTQADYDNIVVNENPAFTAFVDDFQLINFDWNAVAGTWNRVDTGTTWVRRQSDLTGGARLVTIGETLGDQIVEADLRPTQFSGTDRWFGLMARYRDDANYHYVTLRTSGTLQIRKLVNGTAQTLVSVPFTVQANVSYRVRLEAVGSSLRVYVNGVLRAEAADASITPVASTAGVAMYKTALDLDNVVIAQP
ncbi:FG-GAP repeat protein [Steroidobacter agaridevorans]|uniref:FG-GAP repeat protein n=1 Tax=Steroidobacter agaridevorans TaxID=2695856 RepID=UPI00132BA1C9|nr:FG-GAP repeat protein [Steroidobacter agaridevorans]GFE85819.1 hypothetical protein GCM10011488_07730 [Steroidobacter agaridevorans]